ncbi:MAG: hypothetical protein MJ152_02935 [Clostridia bacterium]|nr:hypothetical protein [Clostridia bacterium]
MRPFEQNESVKRVMKRAKRIAITILICIPIMVAFGYFTRNIITSNVWQCICFMAIMCVAVVIEELIHAGHERKKALKDLVEKNQDVFK